jgi:hypothetical protein
MVATAQAGCAPGAKVAPFAGWCKVSEEAPQATFFQ